MKKLSLILLGLLSFAAVASDVSVTIEHPRVGKRKAYTKSVICTSSTCQWQSKTKSGSVPLEYFSREMNALTALMEGGQVPAQKIEDPEKIYVNVSTKRDGTAKSITLGTGIDYRGEDAENYSRLNQLLTRIEFLIDKEEGKK